MDIFVTTGIGEGPTPIAAFDAALINAGIANYNLIYLSSVIPPDSVIRREKFNTPPEEYGHRLYVVMARHDATEPGKEAWAGVGWTQDGATGRGLFVELHGAQRSEVENDIATTLAYMMSNRTIRYGSVQSEIAGIKCRERPVCALSIAVYKSASWQE